MNFEDLASGFAPFFPIFDGIIFLFALNKQELTYISSILGNIYVKINLMGLFKKYQFTWGSFSFFFYSLQWFCVKIILSEDVLG